MATRRITDTSTAMDMYLETVELTEPPLLFHRWCFISCVAAAIGRNVWIPFGDDKIYPNQFITLIGNPGSRKSTAIRIATSMLKDSGFEHFSGDRSSKEKFLADWEHGFDKINAGIEIGAKEDIDSIDDTLELNGKDSEHVAQAFIKAGELEDFLGSGNSNFISTLTNLWDNPSQYTDRFKNSKSLYLPNPTVNLLGGATTTTFASIFSASIIGQGMLSRMILVHGKGQRMKLTIPPPLPVEQRAFIVRLLTEIRVTLAGEINLSEDALRTVDQIYRGWKDLPDSRLATYSSRRLTHLLKLALIITASELEYVITEECIILANTILTYTELYMPAALGEFGKSKTSEVSQIVFDAINACAATGGISLPELLTVVSQDIDTIHDLANMTAKLKEAGKIEIVSRAGYDGKVLMPTKKEFKKDSFATDFELMYEYKFKENDQ